jgi:hypothetical protein
MGVFINDTFVQQIAEAARLHPLQIASRQITTKLVYGYL